MLGIHSGDLPLGAATSLFMFPILAGRGRLHPARRAQARQEDRMSTAALAARTTPRISIRASLSRNRRWALYTSYFFLILFAIFFLIPPCYIVVAAFKSDAEVARMAIQTPWIIADGVTLDQFRILLTQTDFLIFYRKTIIVTFARLRSPWWSVSLPRSRSAE